MKWLTLDYIKQHSRIEYDCEDNLLTLYGEAAEETVLNICSRTYEELKAMGTDNKMPAPIIQASLMLVDHSYQQRSPVSSLNMASVPYTFDTLIKPYMNLCPTVQE